MKLAKFKKHNSPKERSCGFSTRKCSRCGRVGRGHVAKYGIGVCRQCFREIAVHIGFKKYS
ncbi:MAG TPA: 30S ribosomal protein S14 [Candidatus Nanoarchaeia archaeon]|nr:30S ribosomal protein S14 [Candidatus Nanoarchaeia archaeon]